MTHVSPSKDVLNKKDWQWERRDHVVFKREKLYGQSE